MPMKVDKCTWDMFSEDVQKMPFDASTMFLIHSVHRVGDNLLWEAN